MSTKRLLLTILAACAIVLAVGIALRPTGSAHALPPAQAGAAIPYSGYLSDQTGQPVADGAYDLAFALYASATGGEPTWSEMHEGVKVQSGAFAALLGSVTPLAQEALDGARYLEVSVRGPGETEFTLLSPRQELSMATAVNQAGATSATNGLSCSHTHMNEAWSGSGNVLILQGNSDGYATLYVRDTSPNGGYGVYGRSDRGAALYGYGDVKQTLTGDGLVKAGVYVNCNNDLVLGTIRDFNNVNNVTITASPGSVNGSCTIDFGFDLSGRYWVVTADMGGAIQGAFGATCMLGQSNDQLQCFRYLANTGAGWDGNIMVLVY